MNDFQSDSSDEPVALVCPKRNSSTVVSSQSALSGPQLTGATGAAGAADLPDTVGGTNAEITSSLKTPRISKYLITDLNPNSSLEMYVHLFLSVI